MSEVIVIERWAHLKPGVRWLANYLPDVPPKGWTFYAEFTKGMGDGAAWYRGKNRRDPNWTTVFITGADLDGKRWLHFSIAKPSRLPTWQELVGAKNLFLGEETLAILPFVPKSRWISIHDFCLHLWRCVDGDPIPDFARGGVPNAGP